MMDMKVLLLKPPTGKIYGKFKDVTPEYPPLGLAYIAAVLEKDGYEVRIADLGVENTDRHGFERMLGSYNPDVVGITATTPTAPNAYELADGVKSFNKDIVVVMGGPHASSCPEEVLNHADVAVRGEGEYTFLEIAQNVASGKPVDGIRGTSVKIGGRVLHNPDRELIKDLDALPFPARHMLPMKKYRYYGARRYPLTNMFTTRGCPGKCVFCNKSIFGRVFRMRSVGNVMEEIKLLVDDFNIHELHISDDTFTLHKRRAIEICESIKKEKMDLSIFPHNGIRVDTADRELFASMRSAGFYALCFGVESGDQAVLDQAKKGITLEQVRAAFKLAKEFKFETWAFFIFGLPGETKESAERTIKFALELSPDVAKFHILVPYPGTEVYEMFRERMRIRGWEDYGIYSEPTFTPENMTPEELTETLRAAYKRFYFRPKFVARTLYRQLRHPSTIPSTIRVGLSMASGFK